METAVTEEPVNTCTEKDETHCTFASSRGLLKSCDIHSSNPISSVLTLNDFDFSAFKDGDTIYIPTSAIVDFMTGVMPHLQGRFILVSGDCDWCAPNDVFPQSTDFLRFIENNQIIHWYCQNCVFHQHPKVSAIPIGMDYHTMACGDHIWGNRASPLEQETLLKSISDEAKPFWERHLGCYANFQFAMTTRFAEHRANAINTIDHRLVYYEPYLKTREECWRNQAKFAFVLSPSGNGFDCHRTWEALNLGCIPIVLSTPIDEVYADLPVWIVNDWHEVNEANMKTVIDEFSRRKFNTNKLKLKYWVNKIKNRK